MYPVESPISSICLPWNNGTATAYAARPARVAMSCRCLCRCAIQCPDYSIGSRNRSSICSESFLRHDWWWLETKPLSLHWHWQCHQDDQVTPYTPFPRERKTDTNNNKLRSTYGSSHTFVAEWFLQNWKYMYINLKLRSFYVGDIDIDDVMMMHMHQTF